jgi:hypothetical protein
MFKCGYGAVGNCSMANSAVLLVLSTVITKGCPPTHFIVFFLTFLDFLKLFFFHLYKRNTTSNTDINDMVQ